MSLRTALGVLCLLGAVGTGYGVRSLTRDEAIRDGRVYFYGTDGWYHMRRIEYALENRFRLADFPTPDPYLNYPDGGEGYWGPLFDLGVAAHLSLFGDDDRHEREKRAATVPAILGALSVAAAFLAGWSIFGAGGGLAAAFVLAVLPGHVTYSQLGHLDHHVLESLLFGLLLFAFDRLLREPTRHSELASVGLILAAFLTTPLTSIVHVGVLVVYALVEIRWRGAPAGGVSRSLFVSALLLAPLCIYWSTTPATGLRVWADLPRYLLFERYSLLQPMLLLLGAGATGLTARFSRKLGLATALVAAVCAWPVVSGLSVLAKENPDLAFTSETQSILRLPGADTLTLGPAIELFGLFFPLVAVGAGYLVVRDRDGRGLWVLTLLLYALVLIQFRFVYTFAFPMALLLARLPAVLPRLKWLGAIGVALSLFPCLSWLDALAQKQHYRSIPPAVYDALLWMRESTPRTEDYSVLASWDLGHAIVYIAGRPVVADPFNHGFEPMARYFTSNDADEAQEILETHRVRYVIPTHIGHPYMRAMFLAYARRPSSFPLPPDVVGRGPLHLERVYVSPDGSFEIQERR